MPASASPTPAAPLVILPGLICDSRMFGETLAAFPESRVMDGFYGGADRIEAMADHVLARMPARAALLGHSMGGGGTLHLGMKYPGRWAALAPIAPAIYRSPRGLTAIRDTPVIVVQGAKDRLVRASSTRKWIEKMNPASNQHNNSYTF